MGVLKDYMKNKNTSLSNTSSGGVLKQYIASKNQSADKQRRDIMAQSIASVKPTAIRMKELSNSETKLTKEEQEEAKNLVKQYMTQPEKDLSVFDRWDVNKVRGTYNSPTYKAAQALNNKISNKSALGYGMGAAFGTDLVQNKLEKKANATGNEELQKIADKSTQGTQAAKTQNPFAYAGGQLAGEGLKYATSAIAVGGMPVIQKLGALTTAGTKAGAKGAATASRLIAGRLIDLPVDLQRVITNGIVEEKSGSEIAKDLFKEQILGFGIDTLFEGAGSISQLAKIKTASKKVEPVIDKLKAGKEITEAEAKLVNDTLDDVINIKTREFAPNEFESPLLNKVRSQTGIAENNRTGEIMVDLMNSSQADRITKSFPQAKQATETVTETAKTFPQKKWAADQIKIEPSARGYADTSTLHSVNASSSIDNTISPNAKNVNGNLPNAKTLPKMKSEVTDTFGKNTVGAAQAGEAKTTQQLINEYGVIPKGENPARDISIPAETNVGKTQKFSRTAAEAGGVTDETASAIQKEVANGTFAYVPTSDKKAIEVSGEIIKNNGIDGARKQWDALIDSGSKLNKNDIALGEQLLIEASQRGDIEGAIKITSDLASELSEAGKNLQAASMLKKLTPEGRLMSIQNGVNKLKKSLIERYGANSQDIQISDELVEKLLKSKTSDEMDNVVREIQKKVGEQVPATWYDKINAWRFTAMLGNLKTQLRNVLGNLVFMPARKISNIMSAGLEKAVRVPADKRYHSILTASDKKILKKFAYDDYKSIGGLSQGSKFNFDSGIKEHQKIFNSKVLEGYRTITNKMTSGGDVLFSKEAYADSMAQMMKARGYTPEFLQSGTKEANTALATIRNYAIEQSEKAVYRDASALANFINKVKKVPKDHIRNAKTKGEVASWFMVDSAVEGTSPFVLTPVNLARRGVEYSPVGLIKGVGDAFFSVRKGSKTASEAIETLAKGMTGTGMFAMGAWFMHNGWITGPLPEGKEGDFAQLQGEQSYSLNIGDSSFTIDWLAPLILPFFAGAETYNQIANREEGITWENAIPAFIDGMKNISDPLLEMSFLQGVNNLFNYAQDGIGDALVGTYTNYLGQYIPTLSGQIARTIDDTRRTTYAPTDSPLTKTGEKFLRKTANKIPLLSKKMEPYVNLWGQEETQPFSFGKAVENFLSPGYFQESNTTPADKEVQRIYNKTGESGILPKSANTNRTFEGERYDLNSKELTRFQKTLGQTSKSTLDDMIKSSAYTSLSDEEKTKAIQNIYSYADEKAKDEFFDGRDIDYELSKSSQKAEEAKDNGIPLDIYFVYQSVISDMDAKDKNGDTVSGLKKDRITDYVNALKSLTQKQKDYLVDLEYPTSIKDLTTKKYSSDYLNNLRELINKSN